METSLRHYTLTLLAGLSTSLIVAGCSRGTTSSTADNLPVSYYDSLLTCAIAANDDEQWELSDSLTDIIRTYCLRYDCDCALQQHQLHYRNDVTTAICALYSGRLSRAIDYLESAQATAYRHSMTDRYYDVAINIADVYIQAGRLPEAAEHLRHGLYLCDSLSLKPSAKVPFLNALSSLYFHLGDYGSAMRYSDEAYLCLDDATPLDRFSFWCFRGNAYYMNKEFESALQCFDSCYNIGCRGEVSDYNAYIARLNRSDVQVHLGRYDSLDQRLDSCESYFAANGLATCSYYLTTLRARILFERDGDVHGAIRLMQQSPDIQNNDYMRYLRQSLLRECYAHIGLSDSIVALDVSMLAYKDSLLDNLAAMRVADVELRYKENIRETQLLARQQALEMRIFLAILIVLILILAIVITIFHYRNMRRRRDLEREHLMNDILQEKVRSLRQRLSPHYLMNLAHILDNANNTSDEAAIAMTLRHSLELSSHIAIPLSDEISFVKDYLQFLSRATSIDVVWEIAPDVHTEQIRVPGMTLQIPLENAVKHAYPNTQTWAEKKVCVVITRTKRNAHPGTEIVVEDYGVGLPSPSVSYSNGLSIMKRTVAYLNTRNRFTIEMMLSNKATTGEGQGVKLTIFFPDDYDYLE